MPTKNLLPTLAMMTCVVGGCADPDQRLTRLATEAAERQARQSEQMAKSHTELTEGTRHLLESAGRSQESLLTVQKGLETQQAEVGHQRDLLERERQVQASERRMESRMATAIEQLGLLIACLMPLALCWLILCRPIRADSDPVLTQILIEELVGEREHCLSDPLPKEADPRLDFPDLPQP